MELSTGYGTNQNGGRTRQKSTDSHFFIYLGLDPHLKKQQNTLAKDLTLTYDFKKIRKSIVVFQ